MAARLTRCAAGAALVATAVLLVGEIRAETGDLKPFPPAEAGMQRYVIRLPAVADPEAHRVEVIVGRTIEVDCNRHRFSATVTRRIAAGWGFPYYVVGDLAGPATTLMACPPGFVRHKEFVVAPADELAGLRYNARVPIVLYVPVATEVRYRVWRAGATVEVANPE